MPFSFFNIVLVSPTCSITGEFPRGTRVYRRDQFVEEIQKDDGSPLSLLKIVSAETLREFGQKLAALHCPAAAPVARDAVTKIATEPVKREGAPRCEGCGGAVTPAEARFCSTNKGRFAGKALCRDCQDYAPQTTAARKTVTPSCVECGKGVDSKVVAFCGLNSKKFGGRLLCRECQKVCVV